MDAVENGTANLARHIRNLKQFGLTPVVAINRFPTDSDDEVAAIEKICSELGARAVCASHWAEGGAGASDLAQAVIDKLDEGTPDIRMLYPDDMPLADKIRTIATRIYDADDIAVAPAAAKQLQEFEKLGYGHLPVCIAKTQYSFSADPALIGAPAGHTLPVREARLAAGAGFVVAICGDIMTMPGLPRKPSALGIGLDEHGQIFGLS
ncbi:MAG: formate--tetrahydrofolate ligase [Woeseiaceae bacterium]|nr:formate--tetrahydrofolate ligase [Woeseiaceae bacterium]